MNAHELNSYSRIAHAQRISEADQYRLARIAANHNAAAPESFSQRSRFTQIIEIVTNRSRIARAGA